MNVRDISVSGAVTYWSLGWTDRDQLIAESEKRGVSPTWVPAPRAPIATLKSVLDIVHSSTDELVRPLKSRVGYEVVRETRGETSNDYDHIRTITVEDGLIQAEGGEYLYRDLFAQFRNRLSPEALSGGLVRFVQTVGGVPLRPQGALYWVPEARLSTWQAVGETVEASTVEDSASVYVLRTQFDSHLVRAVRHGIEQELEAKIGDLEADMLRTDLGERAFQGRIAVAKQARVKLKSYESDLEVSLSALSDRLVDLETQAAQAAILASARAAAERKVTS